MKTQYAPLGSISHGTMRPEDLIPDFLYILGQLDRKAADALEAEYSAVVDDGEFDGEDADYCLEALFDALEEFAPPYCYFGSHEGDGADYGFWIGWDSLEDDCRYGGVLKIASGDEWPIPLPEGTEYVLEVTDHGNATLLTPDGSEVWSVV